MASRPKKRIPKPIKTSATLFKVSFLENPKTKPTKAIAIRKIENDKDDKETSNPVTVVPKKAPNIMQKPWEKVNAPAVKKPTTITVVAPLD